MLFDESGCPDTLSAEPSLGRTARFFAKGGKRAEQFGQFDETRPPPAREIHILGLRDAERRLVGLKSERDDELPVAKLPSKPRGHLNFVAHTLLVKTGRSADHENFCSPES